MSYSNGYDDTITTTAMSHSSELYKPSLTTLIFDVDDTMYDVGTGFTAHRNGYGATSFMVEKLGFESLEKAQVMRDEYFERYHSTAKALTVMEREGVIPPGAPKFETEDLADWWATQLNFTLLNSQSEEYKHLRQILEICPLRLVAFSNGPRKYVLRVLKELNLSELFPPQHVFAVDDVLPACKPEPEAFEKVFETLGIKDPRECVMIEDSMKNIRVAKMLGLKTILVTGKSDHDNPSHKHAAEATKTGDVPLADDPAVDVVIEHCGQLKLSCPGLWNIPPKFP